MLKRAYSLLEVKEVLDEERRISGMASTPEVDRVGDIVDPMGAKFKNPAPLLLYHDSRQPVGEVRFGRPTKDGIPFDAHIKRTETPGTVKDRLDEAWESVKLGLIKAVSIGFRVIDDGYEVIRETGGVRFTAIEIMELSLVPIPANASATITSIKSIDQEHLRAVSGDHAGGSRVVRLKTAPGVPGKSKPRPKDTDIMAKKTYREQIEAFEAKSAASQSRMDELMAAAAEEGRTFDDKEKQEFATLESEVKEVGEHLVRLKAMAERMKTESTVVTEHKGIESPPARVPAGQIRVASNIPKGIGFARYAKALYMSEGNPQEAERIVRNHPGWKDQVDALVSLIKTAVPAGDTTTAGWASELVYAQNLQAEFIEYLRPMTIIGQIDGWRRVPFNVRMGSMTGGTTGYWVGQGKPIPVSKGTTSSTSLGITKAAGIAALDEELVRSSSPSAEALIRDDLAAAVAYICDTSMIDPNQGGTANVQPASLTYSATARAASGTNYAALSADIQYIIGTMTDADVDPSAVVLVMAPRTALALTLMVTSLGLPQFPTMTATGGTLFGFRVVVSRFVGAISGSPDYGNMIVAINTREIFLADEGAVAIDVSREASLELLDNPTNLSTGATAATAMVSMFQTHSVAMKAVRFINWTKRRSTACQYIRNALYA